MEMTTADWEKVLTDLRTSCRGKSSSDDGRCTVCDGTGWARIFVDDGRSYVHECDCVKVKRSRALIERSGLSELLEECTFANYKTPSEWQKNALETARNYASSLISTKGEKGKKPWFFIGGNAGSGKTHLCTAVCGELLNAQIPVVYMQWLTDARQLKAHVNESDFESMIAKYIEAPVLYVDDLFKQQSKEKPLPTDADVKIAFEIINRRYIGKRPTLFSSEWYLSELLATDEATFGRVAECAKDYNATIGRDRARDYRISK